MERVCNHHNHSILKGKIRKRKTNLSLLYILLAKISLAGVMNKFMFALPFCLEIQFEFRFRLVSTQYR